MLTVTELLREYLIDRIEGDRPSLDLLGGDPPSTQKTSLDLMRRGLANSGRDLNEVLVERTIIRTSRERDGD